MELSKRLKFIANHIEKCKSIADIGTDHGYIPIYAVKNNLCESAIASDINKDPVRKSKLNISLEGLSEKIETRLGGGLEPIKTKEVDGIIIAGMGGNLIRDILEEGKNKLPFFKFIILQPAQNPEVLREYLYENNYEIIKEDLCFDEGVYYELFKVRRAEGHATELDSIYYEISPMLLRQKHPLMREYLESKIKNYSKILGFISEDSESAILRKKEVEEKISIINSMMNYL